MVEIIPDLLSTSEEDLLSQEPVPKTFNEETAETLTVLSKAAHTTLGDTAEAPVIIDSQDEEQARQRFSLLENAEKAKTVDELILDKIIANSPPEEFDALLALTQNSDPSSVLERMTARNLTEIRMASP